MTEEQIEERDGTRRRRGSRGGRGRGGRGEAEPGTASAPAPSAAGVASVEAPRIVGRRPGRPIVASSDESAASMTSTTPSAPTTIVVRPPALSAAAARAARAESSESAPELAPGTRRPARRTAAASSELPDGLGAVIAEQTRLLGILRDEVQRLSEHVDRSARRARLGVFVDVPNLLYGAEPGQRLDMGKLLDILSKDRELVRATAYAPVSDNPSEPVQQQRFVAPFVPYEYRIVTKPLKRFADGSIKGNFDVEMAVDILSMADRLDVMAIVSGDADFARVVEEVQSRGVRVEVVAFSGSTSAEMRGLADHYIEVGAIANQLR